MYTVVSLLIYFSRCMVRHRIVTRVKPQFDALVSGFEDLIPLELINVFDEHELELLIGGVTEIDM